MTDNKAFHSERLILRATEKADALAIANYYTKNRTYLMPFEPTRFESFFTKEYWETETLKDIRNRLDDKGVRFILMEKDQPDTVIGLINYSGFVRSAFQAAYVGYSIDEDKQGSGLMTEALKTSNSYIFSTRNLHRIMANCMVENKRSLKVLEKAGFEIEGKARAYLKINGKWEDHILTALINENYPV